MALSVRFIYIPVLFFVLLTRTAQAQGDVGIILGISNYQGELASYSTQNGFNAIVGPVIGIQGGYALSPRFRLRADALYTRLAGDDELNENEMSRTRNLDFHSPIFQLAAGVDWHILSFDVMDENAFTPYVTGGASLFYMNPMTEYQGEKVKLQPLGTEGQYLDDYPEQKPYSLIQPSLQLGGGMKILTGGFIIALEGMMSYTFTDHLDDVSSIYISYPELLEKAGPLTAALANRAGEYLSTEPVIVPTGTPRGNPDTNDIFGTITLRLGIPLDILGNKVGVRNKGSKRIKCPKF